MHALSIYAIVVLSLGYIFAITDKEATFIDKLASVIIYLPIIVLVILNYNK